MGWLTDLRFRLKALFARSVMEDELDEELSFHVEMETGKLLRMGVPPAEAARRARLAFGGEERFREQARESWGVAPLHDFGRDLHFSARQLAKRPGFTALSALTLALGIGATTALFSVVHGLLLRPLPLPGEERVVTFWSDYNWRGEEFDHVKGVPRGFESLAAYSTDAFTLRTDAGTSLIEATVASTELFDVMGVAPLHGRGFQRGEDRPGAEPVIVLGHVLWQRQFGGDPGIVGAHIEVDGVGRRVVGVMPEGFYFPTPEMDAFVPLDLDPADRAYAGNGWLVLAGRLADGTTEAQLQSDLERIAQALGERYEYAAQWDKTRDPYVVPLREYLLGEVTPALILLLSAVGLLMLMACINVAGLTLTRTVDRAGEMSVRAALGAGRFRLARQVLTESLLLGFVSGAIGLVLAWAAFDVLVASLPITNAFQETLELDRAALVGGVVLALLSGSLISLVPLRRLLVGEVPSGAFRVRTQGGVAGGRMRLQTSLVGAEVLLAVVLAAGASLLVRSVEKLRAIDTGLDPAGVLTLEILLSESSSSEEERALFFARLLERAHALPGVTAAGYINRLPLRDGGWQAGIGVPDRPDLDGTARPTAMFRPVSPEAFAALGVQLVEGRGILPTDAAGAPNVAVINQTFARRIWGSDSPVGKTYFTGFTSVPSVEVVGVVKDLAVETLTGEQPMVGFYAWAQAMPSSGFGILVVKSSGSASALAPALRAGVAEIEPRAAIGRIETMDEALDVEMAEPLRLRFFLGLFSLLGVVLGSVGVYGVVSYSVERRRTEYGIRMALGASSAGLVGLVVRQGMLPVVVGVSMGTAVALAASEALARFLFDVAPRDPPSFAMAAAALLLTGAVAALVPALRASATPPGVALRSE